MPLVTISSLKVYLSYSVFVAAAVLGGLLWVVHEQQGNFDLPAVMLIGVAFWTIGWMVQFTVYSFFRFVLGAPIDSITVGLLGIETRPRYWDARTALGVSVTSLVSLVLVGALIVLAEQFVNGTQPWGQMLTIWHAPGFGLGAADTIWLGGAWLCWVQAVCQLYPLPRSIGRVTLISAVSILTQRMGESFQVHFSTRSLQMIAILTGMIAVAAIARLQFGFAPQWAFLTLLAVLLWGSAKAGDVRDFVLGFDTSREWQQDDFDLEFPRHARIARGEGLLYRVASIGRRRRLRKVLQSERQEASDASRLDGVLNQLHSSGRDSLSAADLALLDRVSKSLRRQRESESAERSQSDDARSGDA
ncbi:MAG: hypothetical protein HKN47_14790 [Pirellulaceae bacterium]|nr:hypothetical protein [Pirellulaceae bacterium]